MQNLTEDGAKTFHPVILILFLGLIVFFGLIGFTGIGTFLVFSLSGYDLERIPEIAGSASQDPSLRLPLLLLQGIVSFGAFVIAPIFYIRTILRKNMSDFFTFPGNTAKAFGLVFLITFSFMVINSVTIEWNQNIDLPESLAWFEEMAQEREGLAQQLTEYLTQFDGFAYFLVAFVVIAIIPAVGEELLFRGLFQNLFNQWFKNPHVAIWVAAFAFSAFHYQFYGLIPRMLLGALFGYLYFWSGRLTLAMFAHFVNNGFTIVMLYLYRSGATEYNIEEQESLPGMATLIFFFILTAGLLYYFRRVNRKVENGRVAEDI
jgi:membrane protease YdiL (CAAX protease family)